MMKHKIFVTGTDTEVGKTFVTALLAKGFRELGHTVLTQKWVETGNTEISEDLKYHAEIMGQPLAPALYKYQNPYLFSLASSPHLAARLDGKIVDIDVLKKSTEHLSNMADILLIEGAGGLLVPLTEEVLTAEVVKAVSAPVLVVAANKLGCVNHILLTINALRSYNIEVLGIIFNRMGLNTDLPEFALADNIDIVKKMSGVPVFGEVLEHATEANAICEKILEELR